MKSILLLATIVSLFFATAPTAFASAADEVDKALAASKGWVSQIDAGQYDESYAFGCGAMHDKVPADRWELVLKSLRTPWGAVTSREQISHVYKPNGFEGTEGEFMIITYKTAFQKLAEATEVIVLKWEDGKWRGAGYNAEAKPDATADVVPGPQSTTETQTSEHVKPEAQ